MTSTLPDDFLLVKKHMATIVCKICRNVTCWSFARVVCLLFLHLHYKTKPRLMQLAFILPECYLLQIWWQSHVGEAAWQTASVCRRFYRQESMGVASLHAILRGSEQHFDIWSEWEPYYKAYRLFDLQIFRLQLHCWILQSTISSAAEPGTRRLAQERENDVEAGSNGLELFPVEGSRYTGFQHWALVE